MGRGAGAVECRGPNVEKPWPRRGWIAYNRNRKGARELRRPQRMESTRESSFVAERFGDDWLFLCFDGDRGDGTERGWLAAGCDDGDE